MLTTRELLAAAKAAQGIPSNYRLARVLGLPDYTLQRWNTGRNLPDDEACIKLAELAGLDPAAVVASIRAEREAQGPMHDFWAALAARLQSAAAAGQAVALGFILALSVGGRDGSAQAATLLDHGSDTPGLYIMSTVARHLARLVDMLRRLARTLPERIPMGGAMPTLASR